MVPSKAVVFQLVQDGQISVTRALELEELRAAGRLTPDDLPKNELVSGPLDDEIPVQRLVQAQNLLESFSCIERVGKFLHGVTYITPRRGAALLRALLAPVVALLQQHHARCADDAPLFSVNGANVTYGQLRAIKNFYDSLESGFVLLPGDVDSIRDALADNLGGVYVCGRVWEAWNYKTMSQDDFTPAEECDDLVEDLAQAVISILFTLPKEKKDA